MGIIESIDHDARSDGLDGPALIRHDRPLTIQRVSEGVHHAPDDSRPDGDVDDAPRAPDLVAFLDVRIRPHNDAPDIVLLQIEDHAHHAAREFDQLARHGVGQPVDSRDAVADLQDGADTDFLQALFVVGDLLCQYRRDFFWPNARRHTFVLTPAWRSAGILRRLAL